MIECYFRSNFLTTKLRNYNNNNNNSDRRLQLVAIGSSTLLAKSKLRKNTETTTLLADFNKKMTNKVIESYIFVLMSDYCYLIVA